MPEILTESFCERCGTRYTFESAAPRKTRRLGQFKTLSKGLKNYVLSDDTSMDEAMAAARSDEEREATSQQLDAFHATFNFCMNCRQYTCGNCWNPAEGRCLTCAPHLGQEILPAPFPNDVPFEQVQLAAEAWPTADLPAADLPSLETILASHSGNGSGNGTGAHADEAEPTSGIAPDLEPAPEPVEDIDLGARLSFLMPDRAADALAEPVAAEPVAAEPVAAEPAAAASEPVPVDGVAAEASPAAAEQPVDDTAVDPVADQASTLASHTSLLLGRFRPGQNIDAELEAYEAALTDATPEPVAPAAAASPITEPEAMAIEPEAAQPEPVAAAPEPVVAPEPEPVAPEPVAPEPVAAETVAPEPEPLAAAAQAPVEPELPREDRIEQPTWRIFAPDQSAPSEQTPVPPVAPIAPPPAVTPQATAEPQWPTQADWTESPSMALLANRSRASSDALWAASAQEVLAPVGPTAPIAGVQPCSNCGLSLSATARFCRRCGSRQG